MPSMDIIDSDDENEASFMEMSSENRSDDFFDTFTPREDFNVEDPLDNEVWDEAGIGDIQEDFPHHGNESLPSVNVHVNSRCGSLNLLLARCLMIMLAYFWTSFHISDNGMEFLLAGLKRWFEIAGSSSQWMASLAVAFPGTLYFFRKEIGLDDDKFVKHVVCPKCHSLYEFDKCHQTMGTNRVSSKCSFVKFPNHRQRWRRQACGTTLLKEVTLKCGSKKLYPHKVYCYKSIIDSLRGLVNKLNFTAHCELWQQREVRSVSQVVCDVFNGRVWRLPNFQWGSIFGCSTQLCSHAKCRLDATV
jgi:hypothetical protein